MSDQTKLEAIEKKVTEARNLINEAKALAAEVGTEFTVEITGDFSSAPVSDWEDSEAWNDSGCTF